MQAKMIAIGDTSMVIGFQLAGLEHGITTTSEDFQKNLENVISNKEFGIIIASEKMLNEIDWRLRKKLDAGAYPVIIPIPGIGEKDSGSDEIRNLIKRALGFDLSSKK